LLRWRQAIEKELALAEFQDALSDLTKYFELQEALVAD